MPYFDPSTIHDPAFAALYERAVHEVVDVFEGLDRPWWLTEGCLIWQLRYGRNFPPDIDDPVDDDIDVMVECQSEDDWRALYDDLASALRSRGWCHVVRAKTWLSEHARWDKLRAIRRGPDGLKLHVDVHSYFRCPERDALSVHGVSEAFPFQVWHGFLPAELVYPLARGRCYGRDIPCPHRPLALLTGWNGGEYGEAPLAIPLRPITSAEQHTITRYTSELAQAGYASMANSSEPRAGSSEPLVATRPGTADGTGG